jgi:HK97 family phage major capsid protein
MDLLDRQRISRASELLADVARPRTTDRDHQPSLERAFSQVGASGRLARGTVEADFFGERATHAPRLLGERELYIPFAMLSERVMATTPGSKGGYLAGVDVQEVRDLLRPWSVSARVPVTIETGLGETTQVLPRITAKSTPYWIGESAPPSDPTVGEASLTPRSVAALIAFTRQLAMSPRSEFAIRRELLRTVGTAIDQAVLAGAGGVQPLGIANTPGIGTTTGASLGQAGVVEMKRKVSEANADDAGIAFVSTPAIRELLEKRERATGSGFVWDRDAVASRPAFATTDMPTATIICGFWPSVYLGIWGDGFVVEIDPSTYFNSAGLVARLLIDVDVAVIHPAAFCMANSVT